MKAPSIDAGEEALLVVAMDEEDVENLREPLWGNRGLQTCILLAAETLIVLRTIISKYSYSLLVKCWADCDFREVVVANL